jgi:hypothetical protein
MKLFPTACVPSINNPIDHISIYCNCNPRSRVYNTICMIYSKLGSSRLIWNTTTSVNLVRRRDLGRRFWLPCPPRSEPILDLYQTEPHKIIIEPPIYWITQIQLRCQFVKHLFNSSLLYGIVFKYVQYCSVVTVSRFFYMGLKVSKNNSINWSFKNRTRDLALKLLNASDSAC